MNGVFNRYSPLAGLTKLLRVLADSLNGVGLGAARDLLVLGLGAPLLIVILLVLATESRGFLILLMFLVLEYRAHR
jgi:hypothetical protein